jgi:uncharacterized protein YacL
MNEVWEFMKEDSVQAVLAWIGGIYVLVQVYIKCREIYQNRSVESINKRIEFLAAHDSDISRIEYGISSILFILAIMFAIFVLEFSNFSDAQEVKTRILEFSMSTFAYLLALYKGRNFKDLVNRKKEIVRLKKKKEELEEKINYR